MTPPTPSTLARKCSECGEPENNWQHGPKATTTSSKGYYHAFVTGPSTLATEELVDKLRQKIYDLWFNSRGRPGKDFGQAHVQSLLRAAVAEVIAPLERHNDVLCKHIARLNSVCDLACEHGREIFHSVDDAWKALNTIIAEKQAAEARLADARKEFCDRGDENQELRARLADIAGAVGELLEAIRVYDEEPMGKWGNITAAADKCRALGVGK